MASLRDKQGIALVFVQHHLQARAKQVQGVQHHLSAKQLFIAYRPPQTSFCSRHAGDRRQRLVGSLGWCSPCLAQHVTQQQRLQKGLQAPWLPAAS